MIPSSCVDVKCQRHGRATLLNQYSSVYASTLAGKKNCEFKSEFKIHTNYVQPHRKTFDWNRWYLTFWKATNERKCEQFFFVNGWVPENSNACDAFEIDSKIGKNEETYRTSPHRVFAPIWFAWSIRWFHDGMPFEIVDLLCMCMFQLLKCGYPCV